MTNSSTTVVVLGADRHLIAEVAVAEDGYPDALDEDLCPGPQLKRVRTDRPSSVCGDLTAADRREPVH